MKESKHGRRELPPAYVNGQMGNVKPQTTVSCKMAKPSS